MTLGRYYGKGAAGRLNMDRLPFRGSSLHYVLTPGPGPNYLPNYAGDSAPTATAWSTGKRTQDGRLSQGPSSAGNVPAPTLDTGRSWRSPVTRARRPAISRRRKSPTPRRQHRAPGGQRRWRHRNRIRAVEGLHVRPERGAAECNRRADSRPEGPRAVHPGQHDAGVRAALRADRCIPDGQP